MLNPQERRRSRRTRGGGGSRGGDCGLGAAGAWSTWWQRSTAGLGRGWGWMQRKEAGRRGTRGWEVTFDVDIVVGAPEPLRLVQVVVVHVLDHHE